MSISICYRCVSQSVAFRITAPFVYVVPKATLSYVP